MGALLGPCPKQPVVRTWVPTFLLQHSRFTCKDGDRILYWYLVPSLFLLLVNAETWVAWTRFYSTRNWSNSASHMRKVSILCP